MKKLLSILLVLCMHSSMTVCAFAEEVETPPVEDPAPVAESTPL